MASKQGTTKKQVKKKEATGDRVVKKNVEEKLQEMVKKYMANRPRHVLFEDQGWTYDRRMDNERWGLGVLGVDALESSRKQGMSTEPAAVSNEAIKQLFNNPLTNRLEIYMKYRMPQSKIARHEVGTDFRQRLVRRARKARVHNTVGRIVRDVIRTVNKRG